MRFQCDDCVVYARRCRSRSARNARPRTPPLLAQAPTGRFDFLRNRSAEAREASAGDDAHAASMSARRNASAPTAVDAVDLSGEVERFAVAMAQGLAVRGRRRRLGAEGDGGAEDAQPPPTVFTDADRLAMAERAPADAQKAKKGGRGASCCIQLQ